MSNDQLAVSGGWYEEREIRVRCGSEFLEMDGFYPIRE